MENIDRWIIQSKLKDSITRGSIWSGLLQELHITTHWVAWVGDCAIPSSKAFCKNLELVTVHVHWVTNWDKAVGNDNAEGVG